MRPPHRPSFGKCQNPLEIDREPQRLQLPRHGSGALQAHLPVKSQLFLQRWIADIKEVSQDMTGQVAFSIDLNGGNQLDGWELGLKRRYRFVARCGIMVGDAEIADRELRGLLQQNARV